MVSRTDLISRRVHAATLSYHSPSFSFAASLVSFLLRNTALRELIRLYASSSFGCSSKRVFARFSCVRLHFSRLMDNCLRHRVNASTVSSCREPLTWLCRRALSSDVCVHGGLSSCRVSGNPEDKTRHKNHRSQSHSYQQCDCRVRQNRYEALSCTELRCPASEPHRSRSLQNTQGHLQGENMRQGLHTYLYCF